MHLSRWCCVSHLWTADNDGTTTSKGRYHNTDSLSLYSSWHYYVVGANASSNYWSWSGSSFASSLSSKSLWDISLAIIKFGVLKFLSASSLLSSLALFFAAWVTLTFDSFFIFLFLEWARTCFAAITVGLHQVSCQFECNLYFLILSLIIRDLWWSLFPDWWRLSTNCSL